MSPPPRSGGSKPGNGLFGRRLFRGRESKPIEPLATSTSDPNFWLQLDTGGSVSLRDFQAMAEATELGLSTDGLDYHLSDKRAIGVRSTSGTITSEHLLFDLTSTNQIYFLLAIIRGDELDLRIYFIADGLTPAVRSEVIDQGGTWFFDEPVDPKHFVPAQLEFARYPAVPPIIERDCEIEAEFVAAGGPLYGDYPDRDGKNVPVIIMEYETKMDVSNPLLLIIEEGGLDSEGDSIPEGGFMTVLMGSRISGSQIEVFPG